MNFFKILWLILTLFSFSCTNPAKPGTNPAKPGGHDIDYGYPPPSVVFPTDASVEEKVKLAAKLSPSKKQLDWQKMELTAFIHYGMNTFTDRGWGSGTEKPSWFTPTKVDVNQWVTTLKNAGFKLIILTVKHHDGFCLWHTKTTKHSVEYSPYKNDIAKEFAEACRAQGMKVGFYLSPWDMNAESYGKGQAYNDFFCQQLTELLTKYGPVDEMWFDGAKGEGASQEYDFKRWMDLINELQPNCITANLGLDARWAGNEGGYARASEWSPVGFKPDAYGDKGYNERYGLTAEGKDLGSRDVLRKVPEVFWFPAEVDISIRNGGSKGDQWFWHADQTLKDMQTLMNIYYKSVGRNANLLLNFPVNKDGIIPTEDVARIKEFKQYLDKTFATGLLKDQDTSWIGADNGQSKEYELQTSNSPFNILVIQEDISKGQRVEKFTIQYFSANTWKDVTLDSISEETGTIGYKRIIKFNKITDASKIKITINQTRLPANIANINIYHSDTY
ncbi:alpha-L-fucosidase [Brachyspira pilosicoli]|uniref:alpha-L-fucosidase n=1 Tax=Brachyspira pilosicoli TaxID=52584 RepID=A0A5C8ETC4_BRAPL|nr:alpha-L-fucosidase [Brachyspira pilosicoli]TXJ41046.1 alpha-1,3/4-fucosidase [Brachyspira pilosicoli]